MRRSNHGRFRQQMRFLQRQFDMRDKTRYLPAVSRVTDSQLIETGSGNQPSARER